jgi:hypothetical protein
MRRRSKPGSRQRADRALAKNAAQEDLGYAKAASLMSCQQRFFVIRHMHHGIARQGRANAAAGDSQKTVTQSRHRSEGTPWIAA